MGQASKDDLLLYCRANGRVCPMPQLWNALWEMLPRRSREGLSWRPAPPLILAAWHDTPAVLKMSRLEEHIDWAVQHGAFGEVDRFLRSLSESQWLHTGDI